MGGGGDRVRTILQDRGSSLHVLLVGHEVLVQVLKQVLQLDLVMAPVQLLSLGTVTLDSVEL